MIVTERWFCAWLLATFFLLSACAALETGSDARQQVLKEKWGIEIVSLRLSAAGHMVDFRYRVLDPDKAETLFVRGNKPYLIDEASGKVMSVPNMGKVGPLRTSNKPKQGRIYWMFFGNGGGLIKSGSKVTITIGAFRVEDLVVE